MLTAQGRVRTSAASHTIKRVASRSRERVGGPGYRWGAARESHTEQLYSESFNVQRAGCSLEPHASCCRFTEDASSCSV